jgi:hypothetical protein
MADNLLLPVCLDRIEDDNGVPVSGARVYVYDAGTSDLKNVYTNIGLTVAAANPIVADAGGYITARYIGTGSYKLVIKDPVGSLDPGDWVTLKTEDNLPGALNTAPFSVTAAKPLTPVISTAVSRIIAVNELGSVVACDPTGGNIVVTLPDPEDTTDGQQLTVRHEGTAGQVTVEFSTVLYTLYTTEQTVTLVSNGVVWKIRGTGDVRVVDRVPDPQCYLTLVPVATDAINPIPTSDQASKTSVYCRPFKGDRIPIFNGMTFLPRQFAQLELVLVSQHEASGFYDVFADTDSTGAVRIGTGPKWSTVTAGAGARGTGGVTTELTLVQGRLVNANSITVRNGGTTYPVAVNRGTYLGSIFIDASAGQVTCHVSYGQSRKWGVWNAYNRRPLRLLAGDPNASWSHGSTLRASRGDATNRCSVFQGLAEEGVIAEFHQYLQASTSTSAGIGIGYNSTSAASGQTGSLLTGAGSALSITLGAKYAAPPSLGVNNFQSLEVANTSTTFSGQEPAMCLTARWRG